MAKLIIAVHSGRISPVFDVASAVEVIEFEEGKEISRVCVELTSNEVARRIREVCELNANILICGAISRVLENALTEAGIKVFGFVCGNLDQVIQSFMAGKFSQEAFSMPGCCGRRRLRGEEGRIVNRRCRRRLRGGY